MSSAIQAILQSRGIDPEIFMPPESFEVSQSVIDTDQMFASFSGNNEESRAFGDSKSKSAHYMSVRHDFLNMYRSNIKDDVFAEMKSQIAKIVEDGNAEELEALFRQRHEWKKSRYEAREQDKKLCEFELCLFDAIPGSKYCINHIHLDKNQVLFVQCPVCHRNHLKYSKCHMCNS